jgi:hypothetical protein
MSTTSDDGNEPMHEAWARSTMDFVSLNNEEWTARIHDGAFQLRTVTDLELQKRFQPFDISPMLKRIGATAQRETDRKFNTWKFLRTGQS